MPTRRELMAAGLAGGATLLGGSPFVAAAARRERRRLVRGARFAHGVASGAPLTDGAYLWTRLTGMERTGRVRVEVAADPGFRRVLVREDALASTVRDFAVKRMVRSPRLRPGERYWYRFVTGDGASPVGRFRTALPADSRETVRIGFFSCQKYTSGFYTAHRGLAEEDDLDLVVSLGDYIYETGARRPLVPGREDATGRGGEVQTLAEYRQKYRLYQSDPDLIAMQSRHPIAAIWDDHEAENDYAGTTGHDPPRERRVPFLERRRAGYLAFFESLPVLRPRDDPFRIYGARRLGQVDLLTLDTRQYRDPLACEPEAPCPAGEAPGRSILGARQRTWLRGALRDSSATWKVVANQVMMMSLDVPTGVPINADQWDGYADERRVVLEAALADGVRDVAVVTRDIHPFFAGTVTTTGDVTGRPAATEFIGGSVTSTGISEGLAERGVPRQTSGGQEAYVQRTNPHIAYAEFDERGYGVLEAGRDELRVTFRAPRSVVERPSPVRDLARFRVARGSARVEVL